MSLMLKRPIILLISIVMLLSLLAACSGGGNTSSDSGTESKGNVSNTKTETNNSSNEGPLHLTGVLPLYNELPDPNNEYWKALEEATNATFEWTWVPSGDYNSRLELMLATGDLPELVSGLSFNNVSFFNAIKNGVFWDLTPFLGDFSNYPNLAKNREVGVFDYIKVDGSIYGIPRMRSHIHSSIHIRKDWLDKYDLPMPTTLDEYKNTLKQLVELDPSGQGTIGISIHGVLSGAENFHAAHGVYDPTYDEDGGLIRDILTPQFADSVEWFRSLYEDGLMPREFSTMAENQAEDIFSSGRAASYPRVVSRDWMYTDLIRRVDPDAYVRSIELEGPRGYAIHLRQAFAPPMYINKNVPEEKVWQILDWFETTATEEILFLGEYGVEGIHHNLNEDGIPVMTDKGYEQMNIASYDMLALVYDSGFKIRNPQAPPEFNKETDELVADWPDKGVMNPFGWLTSETFSDIWPQIEPDYQTKIVQAVIGDITMEEFRQFQEDLRNRPEMKQAFQEFANSEREIEANREIK